MKHVELCELVVSAPDKLSWPDTTLPEVVLAGRSNVGKSSFINKMTNRKKLAYVGNTPGKTRLLNFFNIDHRLMFVDVPGYGYANISKQQLVQFGQMMEDYFGERQQKVGLVLIVDSRHKPTDDDVMMMEFARYHHMNVIVIATKVDKLKKNERIKRFAKICEVLQLPEQSLIPFSSETGLGVEKAWQQIDAMVNCH